MNSGRNRCLGRASLALIAVAFGALTGAGSAATRSVPRIWALAEAGLFAANGRYERLPASFAPYGAAADGRAAFTIETSSGVGRRARFFVDVISGSGGLSVRRYDVGAIAPSAQPVFDAEGKVAYAVGREIKWLDGRTRLIHGLPDGAVISDLEFAPRGGDVAVTVRWGVSGPQDVGQEGLFVVSDKGTRLVAANLDAAAETVDPVWNPSGTWLAYERQLSGQDGIIYAVDAAGVKRRVSFVRGAFNPVWSRDGKEIAFSAASYYTRSAVYVRRLDRSREIRVTKPALDRVVGAFAPNDKSLALTSGHAIATVPVAGGKVRVVARFPHQSALGRARMMWLR